MDEKILVEMVVTEPHAEPDQVQAYRCLLSLGATKRTRSVPGTGTRRRNVTGFVAGRVRSDSALRVVELALRQPIFEAEPVQ